MFWQTARKCGLVGVEQMRIALMKLTDRVIGLPFVFLFGTAPVHSPIVSLSSLLLIRPGGIGDAVLLVPALQALRNKFPSAKITVLAERRNGALFKLCPVVDRVLLYDCPSDLLQTVRGDYDVTIDTEQWHRLSAVVARMTRAPMLIGYATNERSRMFSRQIQYSHEDYESVSFLNLIEPLDIQTSFTTERFLVVPETSAAAVSGFLSDLDSNPFVTIFPGASIPERRWGADRFRKVAERLSAVGIKVVVVGGKEDCQQGEMIVAGGLGVNLAGQTSLQETAAVIDRSVLLVSGDSGVLHIAVGLDKPTVSLFGPGRAAKWGPRGPRHLVINKELSCSPCTTYGNTPSCPINARCMRDITVEEATDAVMMLLASEGIMPSDCCKPKKNVVV